MDVLLRQRVSVAIALMIRERSVTVAHKETLRPVTAPLTSAATLPPA